MKDDTRQNNHIEWRAYVLYNYIYIYIYDDDDDDDDIVLELKIKIWLHKEYLTSISSRSWELDLVFENDYKLIVGRGVVESQN
jgi:hypothetical protein